MTHRTPLRADLIRDRNALYRELQDGSVENVYTLKITNMSSSAREFRLTALPGSLAEIELSRPLHLGAEEVSGFPVRIHLPRSAGQGVQELQLQLTATDDPSVSKTLDARFILPPAQN
jgi:polyferredoxin